ncbi:MAG TPA: hypothetical protein VF600_07365 [Abditibacteriaceae bacterium]|jgi:cytochrome bd-type quinol oxidase subunit 2
MPIYKRLAAFGVSAVVVFIFAFVSLVSITQVGGVNIHDPKYYESKGPFTYTFGDWLREMLWFYTMVFPPLIIAATVAVFILYWLSCRSEPKTCDRAIKFAARAALVACLLVVGAGLVGGIIVYSRADENLHRLNTVGPPR